MAPQALPIPHELTQVTRHLTRMYRHEMMRMVFRWSPVAVTHLHYAILLLPECAHKQQAKEPFHCIQAVEQYSALTAHRQGASILVHSTSNATPCSVCCIAPKADGPSLSSTCMFCSKAWHQALLCCAGANASTSHSLPVQGSKRGLPPAVPLPQPSLVCVVHYLHSSPNCRHPLLRTCCVLVPDQHICRCSTPVL